MLKPQLVEFMRRMDKNSVAIIPAAREARALARYSLSLSPEFRLLLPDRL